MCLIMLNDSVSFPYTSYYIQISPSKALEYIAIGKPIFSICNDNSPIYRILQDTTHIVSKYQKEEIKRSILNILTSNNPVSSAYTITYELRI